MSVRPPDRDGETRTLPARSRRARSARGGCRALRSAEWAACTASAAMNTPAERLDLDPGGQVYPPDMGRNDLFIGELAARGGTTRKAVRLYETAGILPAPRRTASGYRVYDAEALRLLGFVRQAQRLGFTLGEIREIVGIKRAGRAPCPHVRDLVRRKADELDQRLEDLQQVRNGLRHLLRRWRSAPKGSAAVCPHIEDTRRTRR